MNLRKIFTVSVVVLTIFWAVGLAAFVPTAQAVTLTSGMLIKASLPAVYYYGADGKRYVFPNEKTYKTWYPDFSGVVTITDAELSAITIGGNVTMKPGVRLGKITTDPKVYAIGPNGTLRWVTTEAIAICLYGASWGTMVDDISDAFFVNYTIGAQINNCSDFDKAAIIAAATSINVDKGLTSTGTPGGVGALNASLASDTPSAQSIPMGSADVIMTKVRLTAGSTAVTISGAVVERAGLSVDADINSIKLYVDGIQTGLSQTLSSMHKATFTGLNISIPANSSIVLALGADINTLAGGAVVGDEISLKLVGLTTTAASIAGLPLIGNTMTVSGVVIGTATILQGSSTVPATIDPDVVDYKINSFKIQAGSEDITVTQITAYQASASSVADADVKEVTLINEKTGTKYAAQPLVGGKAVFNNLDVVIKTGTTVEFSFAITLLGGSGRRVGLDFSDGNNYSIMIKGNTYGFGITPIGGGATCWALPTVSCGTALINQGTLSINKGILPATGNVPVGGESVPLASYDFSARGEGIQVRTMAITITVTENLLAGQIEKGTTILTNIVLTDENGTIVAGPKAGSVVTSPATPGPAVGVINAQTFAFTDTFTVPIGDHNYVLKANISAAANPTTQIVATMAAGSVTGKGETSGKTLLPPNPPTALITGNMQTILGPALSVANDLTPLASTFVVGSQNVVLANITLDATGGGETVKVSSLTITDIGAGAGNGDIVNYEIWGDPDNTDATAQNIRIETSNDTSSGLVATTTFSFKTPLKVSNTAQLKLSLIGDVQTALAAHNYQVTGVASVNATGWSTGAPIIATVSGVGQVHTVVANGYFTITKSADIPSGVQMVSLSTGNAIMKYKMDASNEAIDLTQFVVAETQGGAKSSLARFNVYKGTTLIGSTSGYTFDPVTGLKTVSLASGTLVIPKDGDAEITITYDIADKGTVTSNTKLGAAIDLEGAGVYGAPAAANYYSVYAVGQSSGACYGDQNSVALDTIAGVLGCDSGLTVNDVQQGPAAAPWLGTAYESNMFSAHKGVLLVSLHGNSPSGLKTGGANLEVLYLTLTSAGSAANTNNGDTVTINDLDLCATGVGAAAGNWALKSWDKATTYAADTTGTLSQGSCINIGAGTTPYAPITTPISINRGTSKTLILEWDATGSVTNDSVQLHVTGEEGSFGVGASSEFGAEWSDSSGVLVNTADGVVGSFVDVKETGLPLSGGTITF